MRYLVRLVPDDHRRERALEAVRSVGRIVGAAVRNAKWTSYGALEVDIFTEGRGDLDTFLAAVAPLAALESVHDLNVAPRHRPHDVLFQEARAYFNSERYWECHEVLEEAWRAARGKEKSNLQGMILVCAALVHHQKGEEDVARGVIKRALLQLDFEAPSYNGMDVALLKRHSEQIASSGRFETFRI